MGWNRCFLWSVDVHHWAAGQWHIMIHSYTQTGWWCMEKRCWCFDPTHTPPVCFALNVTQLRLNRTGQDSNAQLSYRWVWYETREELGSAIGRRAKSSAKLVPTWRSARRPESKRGRIRRLKYSSRQCGEEWVEVGRYTYSAAGVLRWCGAGVGVWKAPEGRELVAG